MSQINSQDEARDEIQRLLRKCVARRNFVRRLSFAQRINAIAREWDLPAIPYWTGQPRKRELTPAEKREAQHLRNVARRARRVGCGLDLDARKSHPWVRTKHPRGRWVRLATPSPVVGDDHVRE